MTDQISKLKAERKQLRRFFTLAVNSCVAVLSAEPVDIGKLKAEFAKLSDKSQRLFAADEQIKELILSDEGLYTDETEFQKECEGVETYRDKWVTMLAKHEDFLESISHPARDLTVVSSTTEKLKLKLPKLDLLKFDIKPSTWIAFWASFKKIHEREDLDPEDKFQLLLRMAREGTPARQLLDTFPPSAENYEKAFEQLKLRYGRDELIIDLYARELLGLVIGQAKGGEKSLGLRQLFDTLEARLMGLESLGVTTERSALFLLPLVESTLPESVLRQWERTRSELVGDNSLRDASVQMEKFRSFLRREVASNERVEQARRGFSQAKHTDESKSSSKKSVQTQKVATATDLVSLDDSGDQKQLCVFCNLAHPSEYCFKVRDMEHDIKIGILKEKKLCFRCLKRFHGSRQCKGTVRCLVCSKAHNTSMCHTKLNNEDSTKNNGPQSSVPDVENSLSNTHYAPVLMQTLLVKVNSATGPTTARLLIDTGSQRSYITQHLANKMKYTPVREEKVVHALFGGCKTDAITHSCYKVRLQNLTGKYACNFDVLDSEKICHTVPAVPKGPWMAELGQKRIIVSDTYEGPIDILVGSDVAGKLFTGRREVLSCGLVAVETYLGWTIMGRMRTEDSNVMFNVSTLCALDLSPAELWKLETIGIKDPADVSTEEEVRTAAKEHFMRNVKMLDDGRYEVCLPWITGHPPLPRGFRQAASRLESNVRKLRSEGLFEAYEGVFTEWLQEGIIEEVPFERWDEGHYLPHRAVLKEGSTTRIRPVFDASAHDKGMPNLNQCLEKGENLIEKIPAVLLRFRLKEIGIVSDIKRAFLQISVSESDRDYLRFLWIDQDGILKIFRHKRVVFGVTSSPYLLGAVIEYHLEKCTERAKDGEQPYLLEIIEQLRRSLYVDNCVTSVNTLGEAQEFMEKARSWFLEACFDLRGWEWSDSSLSSSVITPVLGVFWDRKSDILKVNPLCLENFEGEVTRRSVLSTSQKLFDPLGACSPTSLVPRRIIQESWKNGGTWDTPLSDQGKKTFMQWNTELTALSRIELDRWVKASVRHGDVTLHTFCDASQYAYASVCFLRVDTGEEVHVTLVMAKSRVAPLKQITIPRLELLAATIGARLASSILKELGPVKCYFWSDSTTVLSWIRRKEPWGVFVINRVREIRCLTQPENWHHVPGKLNPADLASRGCNPQELLDSRWWEGPDWLRDPPSEWPSSEVAPNEDEVLEERRKTPVITSLTQIASISTASFSKFAKYSRNVHVVAWMYRYLFNKFSKKPMIVGDLTYPEIKRAEKLLLKLVQEESFVGLKDKNLAKTKTKNRF